MTSTPKHKRDLDKGNASGEQEYARNMLKHFRKELESNMIPEKPAKNWQGRTSKMSHTLAVEEIEFNYEENAQNNHTSNFEMANHKPIVRRGLPFQIRVCFNRAYNPTNDQIKFVFSFGHNPVVTKGTRAILKEKGQQELPETKYDWGLRILKQDGVCTTFEVRTPVLAMVGMWQFSVGTTDRYGRDQWKEFQCEDYVYVLFNPWCKEDGVYMDNEALRQEYVLNDSGKIGAESGFYSWAYGQFDSIVLPVVMYLLEKSGLESSKRGCPIQVSRAISAMLNVEDDDGGVLEGRWDDNGYYPQGTNPCNWTGSIAILEEYLNSGINRVRYGQCWVFAGVGVTVFRALGMPCRAVTCLHAGIDRDGTLTVDKYIDENGGFVQLGPDGSENDSEWNFHVWNEVWMTRPDLPVGYGGWQVVDGCPRRFRKDMKELCGPASLEAVRRGEVGFRYDTDYVFSEVNADYCCFQEDPDSTWGYSLISVDTKRIGGKIITMKVDNNGGNDSDSDMEDITHTYKNKEGTNEERQAVMNAVRGSAYRGLVYDLPNIDNEDVTFEFKKTDPVHLGLDFSVAVLVQNNSESDRSIIYNMTANTDGMRNFNLKRVKNTLLLQPGHREEIRIEVKASDYFVKSSYPSMITINAITKVQETNQAWNRDIRIALVSPILNIKVPNTMKLGKAFKVTFSFQNSLPVALTDCVFRFEGPGLLRPKEIQSKDVMPGDSLSITETFTPKNAGQRMLVGIFSSKQVDRIHGSKYITVIV